MNTEERRAPGATRIAFEGLVEVGGALGPSFEAHAVNVSEEGMKLRTAYLPELGQQVTCRFEAGANETVVGSGEVVWCRGADKGGEFGIRFMEMDAECVEALKRMCGFGGEAAAPTQQPGSKVRLYIDGLASPMRAKIRDSQTSAITVASDLGFLQVGKRLDLENAQTGSKRPASIDRVDVDVDPSSRVPQLVVTLRYADVAGSRAEHDEPLDRPAHDFDDPPARMKGAFAEQAARIGPAVERMARRVTTTIGLLAKGKRADDEAMPRRTTAPAPGGGLRSAGRRVVRGEASGSADDTAARANAQRAGRRRAAVAASVMATAVLGAMWIKRSHHDATPTTEPPGATAEAAKSGPPAQGPQAAPQPGALTEGPVPAAVAPPVAPAPITTGAAAAPAPATAGAREERLAAGPAGPATEEGSEGATGAKPHARPAPFSNGPVHHGNILRLKMDGPVEAIEGAQEPTGFLVKLPGRRSLEAAAPLAARDSRIATIKVTNGGGGAELSVTFKENVPNYRVSARGDSLVIALAPVGPLEAPDTSVAKRSARSVHGATHATHRTERPER